MTNERMCEKCGQLPAIKKERFCKDCKKRVFAELKANGYLQETEPKTQPTCFCSKEHRDRKTLSSHRYSDSPFRIEDIGR